MLAALFFDEAPSEDALAFLAEVVRGEESGKVRGTALLRLGSVDRPETRELLASLPDDPAREPRLQAFFNCIAPAPKLWREEMRARFPQLLRETER